MILGALPTVSKSDPCSLSRLCLWNTLSAGASLFTRLTASGAENSQLVSTRRRLKSGGSSFTVNKGKVDLPKSLNPADIMILSLLQWHFNVKTILMPDGRGTPVDIIGAATDIDFAIYAFNYLRQTFFRCWNEFKKTHANPDKASYYRGLRDGLNAELKAAKHRAEQSYAADQRQTYGLVIVDQQAAITRFVDENYGKLRSRTQRRKNVHSGSYSAGETKGRTIQINRPLPQ